MVVRVTLFREGLMGEARIVYVPTLPGCIWEGDTLEQANHHIRQAIELYLEPLEEPVAPEGGVVEEIVV
jgi:hypothetical protein